MNAVFYKVLTKRFVNESLMMAFKLYYNHLYTFYNKNINIKEVITTAILIHHGD